MILGAAVGSVYQGGYALNAVTALSDDDLQFLKSEESSSSGGEVSSDEVNSGSAQDLFPNISALEGSGGGVSYRKIFIKNLNPRLTMSGVKVWITQLTTDTNDEVDLGAGTDTDTNGSAASYSRPVTKLSGIDLGYLLPFQTKAVWIRRTVSAGLSPIEEIEFDLRAEDGIGNGADLEVVYGRQRGWSREAKPSTSWTTEEKF